MNTFHAKLISQENPLLVDYLTLYCDDLFTSISGYDATKTQVLKHVNGTLTWVTETA